MDPTQPPAGRVVSDDVTQAPVDLHLQAILRGPERASAVINGQNLKVGERLGDMRVLAVRWHSVVIERQGRQQELRLSAPIIQTSRTLP
ncbi:Type II secretory pathway component [Stutzerimonas stutzeri]|uniref:Type II secretory pathway component n=1 Tax=Stutzerimonas stutzeri TaxID=316 RepID=UPI001F51609F